MVEGTAAHRKLLGNLSLRQNIVTTPFLRRNLNYVHKVHRILQLAQDTNDVGGPGSIMISNEFRPAGWDFPTREMLEDLIMGQKPVLQVAALQIRHFSASANKSPLSQSQAPAQNVDEQLDWLPDPATQFRLPCRVNFTVTDPSPTQKRNLHVESVAASIVQSVTGTNHKQFDIKLAQPVFVELEKLFVVTESGTNGLRHWKKTVTVQYNLEVTIQCNDADDTTDFLSLLEDKDPSEYVNAPAKEGALKANWDALPECPPDGKLLQLRRIKGHKSLQPPYGVEIFMGWSRQRDSPLQRYNKAFRQASSEAKDKAKGEVESRQLPTPSGSEDTSKAAEEMRKTQMPPPPPITVYKYREGFETKALTVEGNFCPLCRKSQPHGTFDLLRLHCLTHHDQFKFETEDAVEQADGVIRRSVLMSLADKQLERQPADRDEQMNWVAPHRPFDVHAYLEGEDDWPGHVRGKTKAGRVRAKEREREIVPAAISQPPRKRPAPEEVQNLPQHRPKKHKVPNVPGVRFYHTSSKQLIQPGEYIADSDEDVDQSWLEASQSRALAEFGITGTAKDFIMKFNRHLGREQSNSSVLTRDAIVRFMRGHEAELKDVQWQRQFRIKLNQLRAAGIIGDDIVTFCTDGFNEKRTKTSERDVYMGATDEATEETAHVSAKSTDDPMLSRKLVDGQNAQEKGVPNGLSPRQRSPSLSLADQPRGSHGKEKERRVNGSREYLSNEIGETRGDTVRPASSSSASRLKSNGEKLTPAHEQAIKNTITNGGSPPSYMQRSSIGSMSSAAHIFSKANVCICGVLAKDSGQDIVCVNPRCVRKHFHLKCVGLDRRVRGWRCSACAA